jgi:hypothetical protein
VEFRAGVVETRDATPDVTGCRGIAFGLDTQVADNADALAGHGVLQRYPG